MTVMTTEQGLRRIPRLRYTSPSVSAGYGLLTVSWHDSYVASQLLHESLAQSMRRDAKRGIRRAKAVVGGTPEKSPGLLRFWPAHLGYLGFGPACWT